MGLEATDSPTASLSSAEMARFRQVIYRLFGALFLYPHQERVVKLRAAARELQQEDIPWQTLPFSHPLQRLLAALSEPDEGSTVQVEEEYVRLFQVKPAAPPYESFYMDPDGQARGWIANSLEQEYVEAGLALSPSLRDLPDHIAVELEFMSFLCGREVQAWEAEAGEESARARQSQRVFLGQHLGRWFPRFARQVKDAEPKKIYGEVVEASYAFLRHDLDFLHLRPVRQPESGAPEPVVEENGDHEQQQRRGLMGKRQDQGNVEPNDTDP